MSNPTDEELLKFVATFAGWTQIVVNPRYRKFQWENRTSEEYQLADGLPPYLTSVDEWLTDVWPKLQGSENEWEWCDNLCKLCGADNIPEWVNATAYNRCLALWRTLNK